MGNVLVFGQYAVCMPNCFKNNRVKPMFVTGQGDQATDERKFYWVLADTSIFIQNITLLQNF